MKKLIIAALLLIGAAGSVLAQIAGGHTFYVPPTPNGTGGITAVFLNTVNSPPPAPGTWQTVDVATLGLPSETVAVDLGGFLIITNGNNSGTSDLTIALRPAGATSIACGSYIGQTIAPNPPSGNGSRQLMNAWVQLNNGQFEWCWQRGIVGNTWPTGTLQPYPTDPAFAINLNIEAWIGP